MTCTDNGDGTQTCVLDQFNQGDAAWMLTSTAIVYLMTPGVGFFYGGMVRNDTHSPLTQQPDSNQPYCQPATLSLTLVPLSLRVCCRWATRMW